MSINWTIIKECDNCHCLYMSGDHYGASCDAEYCTKCQLDTSPCPNPFDDIEQLKERIEALERDHIVVGGR